MTGRRANGNRIRGPQSALTDFLASHNISAQQIRANHEQRLRDAEQNQDEGQSGQGNSVDAARNEQIVQEAAEQQAEQEQAELATSKSRKRKRVDETAKGNGKPGKKSKKRDDSDDDYEDAFGRDMYQKSKPKPGQFEHCEICSKRFTVTPYNKTGPEGGLICTPCGKQLAADEKTAAKPKPRGAAGRKRRQVESNRLDGLIRVGPKSLQDLCIEKVAHHHTDIEEFGDLPNKIIDRIGQIFSKKRVLDSRTFKLFLRPDLDEICVHDAANLSEDDFKLIFAVAPNATKLVLRNAGQFKDSVIAYMLEKSSNVSFFQVYGANLISDDTWQTFFKNRGRKLETLRLQWLDASFTDDTVNVMSKCCPNLRQLKLKYCRKLTAACLPALQRLKHLTALSLRFHMSPEASELVPFVKSLGPNLQTLSLENCTNADDSVVDEIRASCPRLYKFRLSHVDAITDAAFTSLFGSKSKDSAESSTVLPPLAFADLSSARDVNYNEPDGPQDVPIGLASNAFRALMAHSGTKLRHLNIASCRHISHAAFCDAFHPRDNSYPQLETINVTFCSGVDTAVIKGIFACCPKLKKIIAFGCFQIEEVLVPRGVALIGVPRAHDAIEKIGGADVDLQTALDFMSSLAPKPAS